MKLQKYMKDYRLMKINDLHIMNDLGVSRSTFQNYMRDSGRLTNYAIQGQLQTGNKNLDSLLRVKYNGIVRRCNSDRQGYSNLEYLPVNEWVEFCLEHTEQLNEMFNRYIASGKDLKFAVSIDRLDDGKGYFVDNMQFITHGLNGFKRNVNPVKVTYNNETRYFMTAKEASRYYDIRQNTFGDMLRGIDRIVGQDYEVEHSDIDTVLKHNNMNSLNDYYETHYIKEWYNGLLQR